jgi:hypothetical protein
MQWFSKCLFVVCAVAATLLLLSAGVAGLGHTDCDDADVVCACACHDATALHSPQDLFIPNASARIVCTEINFVDSLIPHDIFRPPAA